VNELTLGLEDRGRKVSVRVGDRIVLRLPENPTTGYRWSGEIPSFLRLVRDANEHDSAPGAGGIRALELQAERPGHSEITLSNMRSWEGAARPPEQFEFSIEVI
jgi:inhibitor of cysteine peptidase